ncbi:tyrosine-type recombinase/integrase [Rhizobium oryziradicis]|uniref:Tyr recombinase domain-containing protein n=1 Tax=Rhizobium oryziradicis TaxID=1867956 RepID=A0A1Q8ZRV1_9HYPH|nr:site-specific integrase [Rhizobium oryziradicis]OLP44621.1 hypothetical protein BJF95_08970 [Rhizobium oryziradicis]
MNMTNIELPYIEKNRTRHGVMRYYLRIAGQRICRLPDDIESEDFAKAYWKARNTVRPLVEDTGPKPISRQVKPGTFRWLCMEYMRSHEFTTLDITTQTRRRHIMESMWQEPLKAGDERTFADMPLQHMDVTNLEVLRDRKKETPFAADERLKVLRQVFDTAHNGKPITPNIARMVKPFRAQTDGHDTATPADLERFIAHHGTGSKATLYLAIQMYTGLRVSDLAALGPQHRRKDAFRFRLFKNRNRTPVDIDITIHPILEAVLVTHKTTGPTYLVTEFGKPFSVKGLGNRISDWWTQAGMPHLTSHSVRKGLATDVAHNEATDSMLEAMFGWRDSKTSKIYTRNAERSRLARQTVERINWDGVGSQLLPIDEAENG